MYDSRYRDEPRGDYANFAIAEARDSIHHWIDQTVDRARHGDIKALKLLRFLNDVAAADALTESGCGDE
jgi:hypothetical protein